MTAHGIRCGCPDCTITRIEKGEVVTYHGDLPRPAEALLHEIAISLTPVVAASRFVQLLEDKGYVEQVRDGDKTRLFLWVATPDGVQYDAHLQSQRLTDDEPTERLNPI